MLPVPQGWTVARRRRWGTTVAAVVLGAVFVALGVAAALGEDQDAPGLALGVGALWWGYAVASRPQQGPGMASRDGALVIARSRVRTSAYVVGGAAFGVGLASAVGLPWSLAVLAVYAVAVGAAVRAGLGGEMRLDPEGLTFARGRAQRRIAWEHVGEVSAGRRGRIDVVAARERIAVRTDPLDAEPLTVYWTLRYYATHPESRNELADGRALERVRREALA